MKHPFFPQHCLYFFPLPQGHGSLRPTLGPLRMGLALAIASLASLTKSLAFLPAAGAAGGAVPPKPPGAWCVVVGGKLLLNFSKAIMLEALRKMLWQISVLMLVISSSKTLN